MSRIDRWIIAGLVAWLVIAIWLVMSTPVVEGVG